jgi:hypothetical protein
MIKPSLASRARTGALSLDLLGAVAGGAAENLTNETSTDDTARQVADKSGETKEEEAGRIARTIVNALRGVPQPK